MNFSDRYHAVEAIRAADARLEVAREAREERRQRMKAEAKAESERLAREVKAVDNELFLWIFRAEQKQGGAERVARAVRDRLAGGYYVDDARQAIAELKEACAR